MIISTKPRDLLLVLFRQRRRIIIVFAVVNLLTVGYLLIAQPLYEAKAELLIRFGDEAPAELTKDTQQSQLVPDERREILLTNIEIIQSQEILKQLLDEFTVAKVYPSIVASPPWFETIEDKAMKKLSKDLTVEAGDQDNTMQISLLNASPELATAMEARLINIYKAKENQLYNAAPTTFLHTEVEKARETSAQSEQGLEAFKAENGISDLDGEVTSLLTARPLAVATLTAAQSAEAQAVKREADYQTALAQVPLAASGSSGETYREVDDLETRLDSLKLSLAQYQPNSDMALQIQHQIDILTPRLEEERTAVTRRGPPNLVFQTLQTNIVTARADIEANQEAIRVAQAQVDQIDGRIRVLQSLRPQYLALARQADLDDQAYKALSDRLEEGQIADNLADGNITRVSVFDPPSTATKPARPRIALTLVAGFLASVLLSLGLAFLRESSDESFATPEQLSFALRLPSFGSFARGQKLT